MMGLFHVIVPALALLISGCVLAPREAEEERSRLVDLDFAQALSDVTRRQVALEAAQKSFLAITSLRLFDLL